MISKPFQHQRAALRPTKNPAFFDDDDDYSDDESEDFCFMNDDTSSYHSNQSAFGHHDDTLGLAQFLATTGPEEFLKRSKKGGNSQHIRRASRLLQRLRKRPTMSSLKSASSSPSLESRPMGTIASTERRTHIPLPVYQAPPPKPTHKSALRDSGVYSESSEKEEEDIPPVPPITSSSFNDLQFPLPPTLPAKSHARQQPRRPAPLPPAVASAAIAAACPDRRTLSSCSDKSPSTSSSSSSSGGGGSSASSSTSTASTLRSLPAAALKRRSVRMRHVQVQTEQRTHDEPDASLGQSASGCCPHCRQIIPEHTATPGRPRRLSSPPAMASGQMLEHEPPQTAPGTEVQSDDAKVLLAMIEQLKSQLEEEQQSRKQLEQAMTRQQKTKSKIDLVAKEKDRWKGDCLWLQDRVALLPE